MKLSGKLPKDVSYHLTPPPGSSATSMSSNTPGRDLVDMVSLDRFPDDGSWWNFKGSFSRMFSISRFIRNPHVLQDSRKRLGGQGESWQGSWWFILMKLSGKLSKNVSYQLTPPSGSSWTTMSFKTPGRDLVDRVGLGRVSTVIFNPYSSSVVGLTGFLIISRKLLKDASHLLTPSSGLLGTFMSIKNPGIDL